MSESNELEALAEDAISLAERETGHKLSLMQRAFVIALVYTDGDEVEAAKIAGYAYPASSLPGLRANPTVALAIRHDVISQFHMLAQAAISHYRRVLSSPTASDATKNAAAEAVLNRAGILQGKPGGEKTKDDKDLDDYSIAELEAMIGGMEQAVSKRKDKSQAIDAEIIPTESKP